MPVHLACNERANRLIDNHLVRCGHVRRSRAAVGIRSTRGGGPYEEELLGETRMMVRRPANSTAGDGDLVAAFREGDDVGAAGVRVQFRICRNEITETRILPNPVPHAEGGLQSFTTDDVHTPSGSSPADFEPYEVLLLVEAPLDCRHPQDLWRRFTAKAALGLLVALLNTDSLLEDGLPARASLPDDSYVTLGRALRQLAFGDSGDADCDPEPFRIPGSDSPAPRHVIGLARSDQGVVVVLRLFDFLVYRLDVPGVEVRHDVQMELDLIDLVC